MEDKRKTVYEVLKDKTGYKDSFEDFNKIIDNDENARTKVYDVLKNKTGYKDSFDDFNKFLGLGMAATLPVKHDEASQTVLSDSPVETDIPGSDNSYTYRQYDAWAKLTPDARKTLIGNSSFYDEVERRIADDKLLENAGLGTKVHPDSVVSGGVALPIDSRMVAERNFKQEIRGQLNGQIEEGRKEANTQLGEVYDKDFDKKMKFQRDHPFLSSLMDMSSGMKFSRSGYDSTSPRLVNQEAKDLNAAINKLDDAQDVLEESARKGKTHFFGGLLRGLGKKVFDISTWDAGATDMLDTSALLTAATDKESGKQLSHSQNLLLDAAAVDMAVDENFAGDLGRGYKAGQVTAESVPFMLEFMINPASGLGETVTKSIVKRGIQKYGKDAMKTTIKKIEMGAVRAASDLAGAGIMSATTGSGRVVADTQNRMIGDVRYDYDENGYIHYADRETGESLGTALAKAYGANVIENYSEMLGRYFSPFTDAISGVASRGLEKIGLSKVNRFIGEIKASDWGRAITDFEKGTQWNGILGEYAEEVAGGTLNALFIGDQTLDTDSATGVFNLDNNIDTALGVSMMGGFLSGIKTIGYRTPKYKARKSLEKAGRKAESVFGNSWEGIKGDIENADESNIISVLSTIYQSDEYKPEQKEAAIRYASSLKNFQGANLADLRRRTDGNVNEIQLQTENSYDNGYGLNTPEEKNDAKIALEGAIGEIMASYPDMTEEDIIATVNSYGNTPSEILSYLSNDENGEFSPEYISQVTSYLNAKAQYDGVIDNVRDGMEGEIESQVDYITKNTHSDGNIYNATLKVDDRRVYVTGGNIVMGEDGVVDHQQSDKSIVIRDAQTGKLEMIDVHDIQNMQPGVNAEQHKTQIAEQIRQDYVNMAAAEINGVLPFNPGDTYNILNAETGAREELVVQQVEGDLVTVTGVDGKEVQTTKEEVQTLVDRERMLRFKEQYQKETLSRPTGKKILDDGRIISATSANDSEVSFDILDQTGNIVDSDIMPRDEYDSLREIESGTEEELGDDGLPVETDEPLSENPIIPEQDIIEENSANENNMQALAGLPQETEAMPVQEEVALGTQENAVSTQKGMDEAPVIPVDEKGNLQYHKVPIEMTIDDITSPVEMDGEVYNPTEEEVTGIITANKGEAIKLYEKLNSKPPKIGANKTKYFAEKKQWNEQVADAKKQVDYWNEVEAHVKTLYEKPGDTTANEIKAMGEPMNGEELAAMMLGAGKLSLLHGEYKRETGFGNMDAKNMFGLFASKEKGGMTIEQAGEQLMLADLEAGTNFFDQNDPNAGRNAIIDVLSSARTRGGLINYIKSNREAMAERERQAEAEADELAKEQWYQDNYHMTPEEYELWDQGELFAESNVISDEEYQEFMSNFVDEILNEQENDRRTSQESGSSIAESESNEQEGVSGVREPSSPVLQGEESVSAGTIGRTEEESSQVDANSGTEHDTLQSSPSGRELISPSRNQESVPDTYVPSRMEGESLLDYAGRVNDAHALHKEEQKVDTNPTDAQKEAGNYRKGHIKIDGFDITIENPRGSERSGVDAGGKTWSVTMNNTYGYIRGTKGVDGDHIDVFLGDTGNGVYVVDQLKEDGSFDEHKVMYGFGSMDEAKEAYLSNYSPGWKGLGMVTEVSKEEFQKWIQSSKRKTKPFAEYKSVQPINVESSQNLNEEQSIIANAKKNGTYMKAPNGEPTRLDERQWVQVRTKAFKDWFGDWENDAKNASKVVDANGEPLVVYHGTSAGGFTIFNTYGSNFGLFGQGSYFTDNREVAESYTAKGKDNNKQVYGVFLNIRHPMDMNSRDIVDGWKDVLPDDIDVEIGKDATNESIYKSVLESFEYNEYPRGEAQEILYDLPVTLGYDGVTHIGGGRYNDKDDTRHRVWIAMEPTQIKSATENSGEYSGENGDIRFREEKLLSEEESIIERAKADGTYLKAPNGKPSKLDEKQWGQVRTQAFKNWFGDWENNAGESSKVMDENGEPLVVYHGTPNDSFSAFERKHIGSSTDRGVFGRGFYFTPDKDYANSYAYRQGKKGKSLEAYLGIKHPFIISGTESLKQFNSYYMKYVTDDIFEEVEGTEERLAQAYETGTQDLILAGYDGVIARFNGVNEYIAFFPNQIKSATDNNGEFSSSNDAYRFREVKEQDGSKSLVGLHNISGDKLRKALKLGGFANPSAAVIDIDKQSHEGYGEISLVLPSSMVAKSTGRNAGTFSGDAWTPTYPQIERQFNDEGSKRVYDDISKLPKEMQSDVRSAWNGYMEGRDANALAYQFLYEKGEAPELRKIEPVFSEDIRKKITGVDAIDDYDERNAAILKAYIDEKFDGDRAKFEEYIETRKRVLQKKIDENPTQKGFVYRRAVENLKDIEENGYEYNSVKGFYDEVMSDIRKFGGIDTYQTVRDVQEKISQSAELSKEYDEWKENLADKYGIKEVLFKGYTPSGNRVYLPHTLENVSKMMRQQGLAGATGWGGSFSKFAAGLMKPVGTLNGIRQQKGKLTTNHEEIEAFREKWEKVYFDLGLKLNPDASAFDDTGLYRVEEIATKPNSRSFAKREYGVELSDEDVRQLSDMVAAIRNEYPAMYFETKFERPVYLNEFAAAVVPDNASKDIVDAMNGAGIKVFTYKAGDETSRNEAVENASHINGVRFREDSMKTYHGSGAEFDKFNLSHSGEGEGESMIGKGIYTTRDKRIAEEYAGVAGNREVAGRKHLYEVEIPADNGGNYLDYDKVYDAAEMSEIAGRLHDAGVDVDFGRYFHDGKANGMNLYMAMAWNMPEGVDVNRVLSDAGYVGYKYSTRHDLGGKEKRFPKKSYVVFDESHATITGHEQIVSEIEKISDTLHTPVKIVRSLDELPEGLARKAIEKGRNVKGWFDTKTGEVVIYLPNAKGEEDAKATFLHEIVGHKGLRALFGERSYDDEMVRIYGLLPVEVRKKVADGAIREYGGDIAIAMDEFLAEQAERNEVPSWWDKVVSSFRDFLRKMGISLELSDNDVRYLLWRSRKNLERNNPLEIAADVDMRNKLGIGEYGTRAERFRETTDTDEEDMFAEQPDENSVSNPSLLDAYKKRIFELNARISSLERKIDSHITAEELSNEVIEEIKKEIGSDIISEIGKGELSSLLLQVKNAKTKKSLEKIFMNVKRIALSAQSRKLQRMMDKMLSLKVQDVNGKNMSIAKNVDDSTRRIFSFIRGKLSDIKKSGLEDDILYLKRDNRKQQEEIRRLERTIRDTSDISVKDEALAAIEQSRRIIEENKGRIQELRDEKNELEKQIAASSDIDVEKEMSALNEKMDRAAQGETVWTQGDSERMAALNIISGQIMNKSHDFEIQSIELDIQQRLLNNSNLYKDRMKEPSENKRRQINNIINENRRQVVALERLINDTRAMQVKQLQMTIEQLGELISNGKNSLLRRTEEEVKRKCRLIGKAIETVDGKPIDIYDKKSTEEGVLKKFFSAPLGSFEYMCKRVNTKTLGKDGFLYKYFVAGKDGVMKAYDTYVLGMEELRDRLDNKSKEIFGGKYDKVWALSDRTVNSSGVHVVDTKSKIDGGYGVKYEIPLSKGQAMYIYQVWKMNDGRTKLEMQGFDEESIVEIRDFIGNDYIKFADWIQEELLPELREKYNAKYLEMYGTSLADIKDYVPLRIVKKSTRQESDLSEDKERRKTLEERAGSLIKRVVNTRPVDITMNAFDVLFDHGRQMEEWNAYARVRRDLDAVLSNTTFRNQLDANSRGSFHNFYDAAAVATKTYHPDQNKFMDEVLGKLSKGIVGGNIAWRLSTALKQVFSAPAFWGYSQSPIYMRSLLVNAAKMPVTFKWCMESIPSFRERVFQGTAGNEKLEEGSISKYLDKYIETGMIPNKLVDAVTCSIGAKSIYDYRYGQLVKQGLAEDEARNQALMDADIYYNQTQQSSHPAFLSPMQMSRSIMDRMITTYQNSNIGYVRKVLAAYYDLTRSLKWKELQKNYTDMYVQEGMNEDEASSKAYRKLLNENRKTAFEAVLFAWGMNLLWNIGSKGLLGFFVGDGDDDDNDLAKGISFFLTSPIKGMPGGNLLESIASGYGMNPLLVYDELDKFMKEVKFAVDEYGLISPEIAFSTMEKVSRYGGVDLEVLGNIYLGVEGLVRDGALSDDKMIDFMYMLNSPKSNRAAVAKELYKDESVASFAEKVARANKYISKHDSWEGWVPGTKDLTKRRKKDIEKEYERFHMTDDEKKYDDEKKIADKHRRKLKELDDDPFALADYIDSHKEEHKIYRKYY